MKPRHLTRLTAATKDWDPDFVSSEAAFTFTALRLWSAPLSAGSSCLADKRPWHRTPSTEMGPRYRPSQRPAIRSLKISTDSRSRILNIYEHNKENRKTNKTNKHWWKKHHKDSILIGMFLGLVPTWKVGNGFHRPFGVQKNSHKDPPPPREEASSPQKEQVCNALDFCSKE